MRRRYLLDTCVLIWFLENNPRIKELIDEINYYQGDYTVSVESIKEFIFLTQSGKLKTKVTYKMLLDVLKRAGISVLDIGVKTLDALVNLPFYKTHTDPADRVIIAQAISDNRILISGDQKFKLYKELKLLTV